jgi:hypothetical protein
MPAIAVNAHASRSCNTLGRSTFCGCRMTLPRDEWLLDADRFRTLFDFAQRAKFNMSNNEIRKDEMRVSYV